MRRIVENTAKQTKILDPVFKFSLVCWTRYTMPLPKDSVSLSHSLYKLLITLAAISLHKYFRQVREVTNLLSLSLWQVRQMKAKHF